MPLGTASLRLDAGRLDDDAKFSMSSLSSFANCSGVPAMIARSEPSSLARASGAVMALTISALSRATSSGGMFGGPRNPNQVDGLRNVGRNSLIEGTSGIFA